MILIINLLSINRIHSFIITIHVGLPSQVASLVTESVITSSTVVLETLQSQLALTEVNSKVTATKLAIPTSPNFTTSSLQISVTPTSYEVNVYRVNL